MKDDDDEPLVEEGDESMDVGSHEALAKETLRNKKLAQTGKTKLSLFSFLLKVAPPHKIRQHLTSGNASNRHRYRPGQRPGSSAPGNPPRPPEAHSA